MRRVSEFPQAWTLGTLTSASRAGIVPPVGSLNSNVASPRVSTLRRQGATAGYQVTAGKTLVLVRLVIACSQNLTSPTLRYTDDDLGFSAAGPGTNPVYLDSTDDDKDGVFDVLAAEHSREVSVYYEIPAGKYPGYAVKTNGGAIRMIALGIEL